VQLVSSQVLLNRLQQRVQNCIDCANILMGCLFYLDVENDERRKSSDLKSFQCRVFVSLVFLLNESVEFVQDAKQWHLWNDVFSHLVGVKWRSRQVTRQVHERRLVQLLCTAQCQSVKYTTAPNFHFDRAASQDCTWLSREKLTQVNKLRLLV